MSLTLVLSVGSDRSLLESRNLLLQFTGYTVISAFSAEAAVRRFHEGEFDLVLLDYSLPACDRERVARSIRKYGPRIPILSICPGFDDESMGEDARVTNDPLSFLTGVRTALTSSHGVGRLVPGFTCVESSALVCRWQ